MRETVVKSSHERGRATEGTRTEAEGLTGAVNLSAALVTLEGRGVHETLGIETAETIMMILAVEVETATTEAEEAVETETWKTEAEQTIVAEKETEKTWTEQIVIIETAVKIEIAIAAIGEPLLPASVVQIELGVVKIETLMVAMKIGTVRGIDLVMVPATVERGTVQS